MTSQRDTLKAFTDAAADAVARAIAGFQRESQRERDVRDAEYRARVAELEAKIASVSVVERQIAERLASLKDGTDGVNGANGNDGASVTIEDVAPIILPEAERIAKETAERIVDSWERPKDGTDGTSVTLDDVIPVIEDRIQVAVSAIPAPKDGSPGLDADMNVVAQFVSEEVARVFQPIDVEAVVNPRLQEIREEIAALPKPEINVPDDVAENVALAIRMMAELPQVAEPQDRQPIINVTSNVSVPQAKASNVSVTMPEIAAPVVNVAPPNVVIEAKRSKELTKVTSYDKSGRIATFEKTEIDD